MPDAQVLDDAGLCCRIGIILTRADPPPLQPPQRGSINLVSGKLLDGHGTGADECELSRNTRIRSRSDRNLHIEQEEREKLVAVIEQRVGHDVVPDAVVGSAKPHTRTFPTCINAYSTLVTTSQPSNTIHTHHE